MKLFPAIDIKDGKCVRLKQGKFSDVTVYCDEPYKVAKYFEECGADYIHLVDLDGALQGQTVNANAIKKIVEAVNIPVELGGGIRSHEDIQRILDLGVDRVIIGTKAVQNPEFVKEAVEKFGSERIVVGVDAKNGMVAISGWEEVSNVTAIDLCNQMKSMGVKTIIYTDISKDGMLTGPNVEQTKLLSDATGLDIVASGGMSKMDDLVALSEQNIYGAIIGKAIYENKIDLVEAVGLFKAKTFMKLAATLSINLDSDENELLSLAESFNANGADEIIITDNSNDDASHERAIAIIKNIATAIDIPVVVGGNVKRVEDVKKYIYAGARNVYLQASKASNIEMLKEVADRFGKEKISLMYDCDNENALELAKANKISGVICYDAIPKTTLNVTSYENGTIIKADANTDFMAIKQELKTKGYEVNTFTSSISFDEFKLNSDGMIPVIVQDYKTNEVLMLAYMNKEAFELTVNTGKMTYFSRSRNEIWVKGLTSGHFQYVMSMEIDCDNDTLLAKVRQVGAACHTGNRSCFYRNLLKKDYDETNPLKVFDDVMATIEDRKLNPKEGSYTNYLFDKGIDKILKKVGEEATEIIIAAKNPDKEEIKYEISDFLYHVMVLMSLKEVSWDDIIKELARR